MISAKRAISEIGFDPSEVKESPINIFLTFSSHLDTGIPTSVKNLEILLKLSMEGGGPKQRN